MAPIVIGSCAAVMLLSNARTLGGGFKRALGSGGGAGGARARRPSPRPNMATDGRSLAGLRNAILGSGKPQIASVFGPPHSAAIRGGVGDTWYYPLQPREKLAMAISFDDGTAREVEFFHAPD
ncbi:MAG TPA: hypothetical protein VLI90_03290 [Tepidisphaeraceae bacterium]|nr:hypothetical protein [Tepidisphaeraceae bacterium]